MISDRSDRKIWVDLAINTLKSSKIVIIQGLRRIGKTLVQKTVMNDSLFDGYDRKYVKVGFFGQNDNEVLTEFFNKVKDNPQTKFMLFIDEFQDYADWDKLFFSLYDFENVKVLATGSISASLIDGVKNSQGGRYRYIYMLPLSYNEYITINEKRGRSDDEIFDEYATFGSYPDQEFTGEIAEYRELVYDNIIEKIISQTNLKRFVIEDAGQVKSILLHLVECVGQPLSLNSVSTKLKINIKTVEKIINFLKQSFVIYEIGNSEQSKGKAAVNNRKYYLTDHTFYLFTKQTRFGQLDNKSKGFVFENIIFNQIRHSYNRFEVEIRFNKSQTEDIDMVIQKDDKNRYFEIKCSEERILSPNQKEFFKKNKGSVIYMGKTEIIDNIQYINYIEFIKEVKKWI